MDFSDRPPPPPSPEIDFDDAAARLGGPVLITEDSPVIGWSRHAIDDDLEYVELETDDQDDPLLVHTRRRAVPLRTLISLLERHAQRCGIATWGDLGMPDAVSTANLVINGVPTTGHVIDGGTVLAAVARAGAVSVSLVSSAARLERHGWPALVTARGQLR